jgi:hypothetical protein
MRFATSDWKNLKALCAPSLSHKTENEFAAYGDIFLDVLLSYFAFGDSNDYDGDDKTTVRPASDDFVDHSAALRRLGTMKLIRSKLASSGEEGRTSLFSSKLPKDIVPSALTKHWTDLHDVALLISVLKHGYGMWRMIMSDGGSGADLKKAMELHLLETEGPPPLKPNITAATENIGIEAETPEQKASREKEALTEYKRALANFKRRESSFPKDR